MQTRAILEAAAITGAEPEIMIPLVAATSELSILKALVVRTATETMKGQAKPVSYKIGTMIELPAAALLADKLAEDAEFFSFGTNDLTQTTLGLSRDDAGRFLPDYIKAGIFAKDPFQTLDTERVGQLVRMAVEKGRHARPGIKLGICGEHGGDPASIAFCETVGLDYVSCSPYRVPIARLAAAQASIRGGKKTAKLVSPNLKKQKAAA
jgi:pyruvate,orthophosphate dikinase